MRLYFYKIFLMIKNVSKAFTCPMPILLVTLICTGEPIERSKR